MANAPFEIYPATASFDLVVDGVVMPRMIEGTTDSDGRATVNLWATPTSYLVTMLDPETETGLRYRFYVPEVPEGEEVRLQDIVVPYDTQDVPYVDLVYQQMQQARDDTLAYRNQAVASAEAVAGDAAQTAEDRIQVALDRQAVEDSTAIALDASQVAAQAGNAVIYTGWTAGTRPLSGVVGAGTDSAIILDDAGTHTDPVVGGVVNNAGIYLWHPTATVGWQRISDTEALKAQIAATAAAAEGPTFPVVLTGSPIPLGGYPAAMSTPVAENITRFYFNVTGGPCTVQVLVNGAVVHAGINLTGTGEQRVAFTVPAKGSVTFVLVSGTPTFAWFQIDGGTAA